MTVRQRLPLAIVLLLAIVACLAVRWTMRDGIGLTNDSHAYLRIAEGLDARLHGGVGAAGTELSRRFPPGLPTLLVAGRAILRVDFQRAARLLNVACLLGSTLLIAAIVRRAIARPWPAVVASALFVASIGTLSTHVFLWSEPAFTLVLLGCVLTLGAFLDGGRARWLIATAALLAIAISLRYAAAALVLAACLVVLFRAPRERVWQRLRDAVALGVAPTLALLAWLATGPARGNAIADRSVAYVPIAGRRVEQALRTIGGWIFAGYDARPFAFAMAALAIAALAWAIVRAIRSRDRTLALPWAFACAYPLFLVVSMSLFDPDTPLDPRILAPLHAIAIVLLCATLGRLTIKRRGVSVAIASIVVSLQAIGAASYLRVTAAGGMGYGGGQWRASESVRYVLEKLPADATVFTTHQTALQLIVGRPMFDLPYRHDGAKAGAKTGAGDDADFKRQCNAMLRQTDAGGRRGFVVYVKRAIAKGKTYATPKELALYFRIERVAKLRDGEVYKIESRSRPPGKRKKPATTKATATTHATS